MISKEFSEVHVLVHPHYAVAGGNAVKRFTPSDELPGVRSDLITRLAKGSRNRESRISEVDLTFRFYKAQIDQISKNPDATLIILKNIHEDEFKSKVASATINSFKERNERRGVVKVFSNHLSQQQNRLIAYAQRKLKKRITVLEFNPRELPAFGKEVSERISSGKLKVASGVKFSVFGEDISHCVHNAHVSLQKEGFNSVIATSKCPPSVYGKEDFYTYD